MVLDRRELVIEVELPPFPQVIGEIDPRRETGTERVTECLPPAGHLTVIGLYGGAVPGILPVGGVGEQHVISRDCGIDLSRESRGQQILLGIPAGEAQVGPSPGRLAYHEGLHKPGLDLLVSPGVLYPEECLIGPPHLSHPELHPGGEGAVPIVEAREIPPDEVVRLLIPDRHPLHRIVIPTGETAQRGAKRKPARCVAILSVQICTDGAKGAKSQGGIQEARPALLGDDIHRSPERIHPQLRGDHALVDLYSVNDIGRQRLEVKATPAGGERNPIDEVADRLTTETIDRQLHA